MYPRGSASIPEASYECDSIWQHFPVPTADGREEMEKKNAGNESDDWNAFSELHIGFQKPVYYFRWKQYWNDSQIVTELSA